MYKVLIQSVLHNHGAKDLTTTVVEFDDRNSADIAIDAIQQIKHLEYGVLETLTTKLY